MHAARKLNRPLDVKRAFRIGRLFLCALSFLLACGTMANISLPSGEERCVALRVAESASERARGLVGMPPLNPQEGLLIVFPGESEVCITGEGVGYAIEAHFIDRSGVVRHTARIEESTVECASAAYVLELLPEDELPVGTEVRF